MTAKTHASHDLSARGRPESDHTEAVNHHGTGYCEAPSAADGALSFLAEADQTDDAAYVFRRANVRTAAFRLLLEGGHPVSVVEIASASGETTEVVADIVDRAQAAGRVRREADGRITGIAGLSVEPTPHRITIADETRWTWCALDAIGILGALQADGTVHSTDATTGNPVDIRFHNGTPLDLDAALFIAGDFGSGSVVDQWCPLVNFFETPDNATQWADANRVEGNAYTVTQLIDQVTEGWEQVVDPKAGKTC